MKQSLSWRVKNSTTPGLYITLWIRSPTRYNIYNIDLTIKLTFFKYNEFKNFNKKIT